MVSHKMLVDANIAARNAAQELRSRTIELDSDDPYWSAFYATVEHLNRTFNDKANNPNFATTDKTQFAEHNLIMNLAKLVLGVTATAGVAGLALSTPATMLPLLATGLVAGKGTQVYGTSYRTPGFNNYSKQIYLVGRLDNQWNDLKLDTQLTLPQYTESYNALRRWVD